MSHVATVEVVVLDLDAFEAAVKGLGGVLKRGQRTYRWFGRWVGDTPMPAGMRKEDLGKCDHAASFPGCSYDVGLVANGDGSYTLAYDYWRDGGLSRALGGDKLPKLVQAYASEKVLAEARRMGCALESRDVLEDGTIRLRVLAAR